MNLASEKIILENEIIRLEPLSEKHLNAFEEFAIKEPTTWKYSLVNPGGSKIAMKSYVDNAINERSQNKSYCFTVIEKKSNKIVGCTRFYDVDFSNKVATIGYTWYGEKYRRTGINRQCKLLLLTYAFEVWNLERVEFRADINNIKSITAMKVIGCVEEGILRSHTAIPTGGRRTSMILSILKNEWENRVKENLIKKIYVSF